MSIAGILATAAILWFLWRPVKAAFSRRFAIAYPSLVVKLRIALGLVLAVLVVLCQFVPESLWLLTAVALVLGGLERWRARPAWGKRRGLPPGSLQIFPASWADDRFYLKLARQHGPIFKTSNFFRPTACIVGLEIGTKLLREYPEQLGVPFLPFSRFVPGGMLRYMQEPHHQHYRDVFRGVLAPRVIQRFEAAFRSHIKDTLREMSRRSQASPLGLQPLPDLERMMLQMWLQLFFGIEPGSGKSKLLLSLYPVIDITNPLKASPRRIRRAVAAILEIVETCPAEQNNQALPCLLSLIGDENSANAKDPVVIGNLVYMLSTTAADMSALLNWIMQKACDHAGFMRQVAAENHGEQDDRAGSMAERFVMETLRMRQSEFIYRSVIRDFDFEGYHIPKGWLLRICVWESHRDPGIFAQPDEFNPDRFLGRSYNRNEYSPFGLASHACLAPFLVNSVARVFVSELACHYRISSLAGGSAVLASTRHWAPGSTFRIRLETQL